MHFHDSTALLAALFASPREAVLLALLATASVIDWRTYRVPNWLTAGGMAFGLIFNTAAHGFMGGLLPALAGLAAGLALLLPLYVLRVMGAGDVKLMAMVGAFLGISQIAYAVLFTLIAGGAAALLFALYHRTTRRLAGNVAAIVQHVAFAAIAGVRPAPAASGHASAGRLPYAVSIAAGTLGYLAARLAGFV